MKAALILVSAFVIGTAPTAQQQAPGSQSVEAYKVIGNIYYGGSTDISSHVIMKADVFLAQHPAIYGMADKVQRLKAGGSSNPFIAPQGYQRAIAEAEGRYLKQLADERATAR